MKIIMKVFETIQESNVPGQEHLNKMLKHAELLTSHIALLALMDWQKTGWVDERLYNSVVGLTRPSWGNWMGLLQTLIKIRHEILISEDAELKDKISEYSQFNQIIDILKERIPSEMKDDMRKAFSFMNQTKAQISCMDLFSILISMRNYIQHYFPNEEWFVDARLFTIEILKFLAATLRDKIFDHLDTDSFREPLFVLKNDEVFSFFGFDKKGIHPVYVNLFDATASLQDLTDQVKAFFAELLGEKEYNEKRIKDLLKKLAPEEHMGVMIREFMIGAPFTEGGFATVHKGINLNNKAPVAVKILKDNQDVVARERFLHEAAILERFNNDHIVGIFNSGTNRITRTNNPLSESDEQWYKNFGRSKEKDFIAMEWVEGLTLDDIYYIRTMDPDVSLMEVMKHSAEIVELLGKINALIDDEVKLNESRSELIRLLNSLPRDNKQNENTMLQWFRDSARTIHDIHSQNMIHRDIKPSNIMINTKMQVKVMDFGIARTFREEHTRMTQTGQTIGTVVYMSPEQLMIKKAESELGPATDIYSLCASFYELFTNNRLYNHDVTDIHTVNTLKTVQARSPVAPMQIIKKIDRQLNDILMGGLQINPIDRYKSMEAMWLDIDRCMNSEPILYKKPPFSRRMKLFYKRNRTPVHISIIAFLLIIVFSVIYAISVTNERNIARTERNIAQARYLAAQADVLKSERQPHLIPYSVQLAAESVKRFPNFQGTQTLFEGLDMLREPKYVIHNDGSIWKLTLDDSDNTFAYILAHYGKPEETVLKVADLETGEEEKSFSIGREVSDIRYVDNENIIVLELSKSQDYQMRILQQRANQLFSSSSKTDPSIYLSAFGGVTARNFNLRQGTATEIIRIDHPVAFSILSEDGQYAAFLKAADAAEYKADYEILFPAITDQQGKKIIDRREIADRIEIYRFTDQQKIFEWKAPGTELLGFSCALSPDNRYVAVIANDSINLGPTDEPENITALYIERNNQFMAFHKSLAGKMGKELDKIVLIKDPVKSKEAQIKYNEWLNDTLNRKKAELQIEELFAKSKELEKKVKSTVFKHKTYILNCENGSILWKKSHNFSPTKILFSPNSCYLALFGPIKTFQVWDIMNDRLLAEGTFEMPISNVVFSDDSRFFLAGIHSNDAFAGGLAHVYDLEAQGILVNSLPHYGMISALSFSPDNSFVAISSSASLQSASEKQLTNQIVKSFVPDVGSAPATVTAYDSKHSVRTYNVKSGDLIASFPHKGRIGIFKLCDNATGLITTGGDGNLIKWDFSGSMNVTTKTLPYDVVEVGFSNNSDYFYTVAIPQDPAYGSVLQGTELYYSNLSDLQVWNTKTGMPVLSLYYSEGLLNRKDTRPFISFSNHDKYVIRGRKDTYPFYGSDSAFITRSIGDCLESKWTFASEVTLKESFKSLSMNEKYATMTSGKKRVYVIDMEKGEMFWNIKVYRDKIKNAIISNDGLELIIICDDEIDNVKHTLIETYQGNPGEEINEPSNRIILPEVLNNLTISHSQKYFISITGSVVSQFNIQDGKQPSRKKYNINIWKSRYSRDDSHFGLACDDGTARVVNITTGAEMEFKHEMNLNDIDISPDNKYLVCACDDNKAHIWEINSGRKVLELEHEGRIYSVAFSPDGKYVLTGSKDKTARIWYWQEQDILDKVSRVLTKNMTEQEWNKYVHGLEYTKTFPELE